MGYSKSDARGVPGANRFFWGGPFIPRTVRLRGLWGSSLTIAQLFSGTLFPFF